MNPLGEREAQRGGREIERWGRERCQVTQTSMNLTADQKKISKTVGAINRSPNH